MQESSRYRITIFLTILFMGLLTAPTVIASVDDSIDTACFFSITEEEENSKVKLLFDKNHQTLESVFEDNSKVIHTGYVLKQYPDPYLNAVFPPPDYLS